MLDEVSLTEAMADVGYERLKRHAYRAEWSTSKVEHFIYFQMYGHQKSISRQISASETKMLNPLQ